MGSNRGNSFKIETVIDSNLPPVRGDETALKRAMENHQQRHQMVVKSLGSYPGASIKREENEVRITVEDRGRGMGAVDVAASPSFYRDMKRSLRR